MGIIHETFSFLPSQKNAIYGQLIIPTMEYKAIILFLPFIFFHYNFIRNQIPSPSGRDGQVLFSVCGTEIKTSLKLNHTVEKILQNFDIFNIFATMLKIYQ